MLSLYEQIWEELMFHTVKKNSDSGVFLFLTVNQWRPGRYSNRITPESGMLVSPSVSDRDTLR